MILRLSKAIIFIFLFLVYCLFVTRAGFAQQKTAAQTDSLKTIPDTLLFRIQTAQSAITEINASNKKGYAIEELADRIKQVTEDIAPLKAAFAAKGSGIDTRNLLSYDLILRDAETKLKDINKSLVKNSNDLQSMSKQVQDLSADSLLDISGTDEKEKTLYVNQIADIKNRLQETGKTTGNYLQAVNELLANTSSLGIEVSNLRAQTAEGLEASGKLAISKQNPYLWQAPLRNTQTDTFRNLLLSSYKGQQEILRYFISSTWDNRILALLIAVAYFIWVHRNFNSARRASVKRKIGELKFDYIRPFPVMATLIVLLNITPLFEPDAPSLYVELIALVLLIVMTIHLWKQLPPLQLRFWVILIALYLLLIAGNAAVDDGLTLRLILLLVNLFFMYLGYQVYRKIAFREFSKKYVRAVIFILMAMNLTAVMLNIFGRVDLAKILSITGVIGFIQLISLAVFLQIMLDSLDLQIRLSSCTQGIFSRINQVKSKAKFKKALSVLCLILWIMVFLINLNLIGSSWSWVSEVMKKPRTFGSIHFSFGNILFFVVIVYLANKLQKHVPLLFGEEKITFNESSGQKGSKVALARLVIIILGVLLAVMASGLPMDKLTVVLGAFGVGIGLGMQNIVNNFVSGIILIFEKPFRIGDYVELADKKGKVRDIGIRSSRLLTPQGSEVIIPNGDLLSGRLVNWTLSNDYIKSEVIFKVPADADLAETTKLVLEVLNNTEEAAKKPEPEILLNNITADALEVKVLVWISNIYVESAFKNAFLRSLLEQMRKAGTRLV